jgi:hypothetical protein
MRACPCKFMLFGADHLVREGLSRGKLNEANQGDGRGGVLLSVNRAWLAMKRSGFPKAVVNQFRLPFSSAN